MSHRRTPLPADRRRRRRSVMQRLMAKVSIDEVTGCWNWTAYVTPAGYGQFYYQERSNNFAHRAAYLELVGAIPAGMQLDHLCRNRACCNPGHLEPVTAAENLRRGYSPLAIAGRSTHCRNGHEYVPSNLYVRPTGTPRRECKACRAVQVQRRKERVT